MTPFASRGNSIVEYAIPLGVFFVAGLAVIIISDVPTRMADYFTDTIGGEATGASVAVAPLGSGVTRSQSISSGMEGTVPETVTVTPAVLNPENVCFQGNVCFNLEPIADSINVETAGGNGNDTVALANSIQLLADQLEDAGLEPELVDKIGRLANHGHAVGASIQNYEVAKDKPQTQRCFGRFRGTCERKNKEAIENKKKPIDATAYAFYNEWKETQAYLAQQNLPPEVMNLVNAESNKIVGIASEFTGDLNANIPAGRGGIHRRNTMRSEEQAMIRNSGGSQQTFNEYKNARKQEYNRALQEERANGNRGTYFGRRGRGAANNSQNAKEIMEKRRKRRKERASEETRKRSNTICGQGNNSTACQKDGYNGG